MELPFRKIFYAKRKIIGYQVRNLAKWQNVGGKLKKKGEFNNIKQQMGSVTYNFLADSLFFHENSIKNNFINESDERIEKELQDYREHCIANYDELIKEIVERDSFLKVFSSSDETPINLLKQTSLYVDQFIVKDPLFPR